MIRHTTLMRRVGTNGAAMLGVLKYFGGDLSGISRAIYRPSMIVQAWFSIKYWKRVQYCATVFYDKSQAEEIKHQLKHCGIEAVHTEFKYYNVMKAKMFLKAHEATALRLIA